MYECENVINIGGGKKWKFTHGPRRRKKVSSNIHNVASFLLATIYLHSIHKIMCKTFLNNNNNFIFFFLVEKEASKGRGQVQGGLRQKKKKYWMEWNGKKKKEMKKVVF